jgi:hypothetical protein
MKIAEALALRADLQKRLEQLKQRLVKNARIQEGHKRTAHCDRVLPRADLVSVGEGGKGALVHARDDHTHS